MVERRARSFLDNPGFGGELTSEPFAFVGVLGASSGFASAPGACLCSPGESRPARSPGHLQRRASNEVCLQDTEPKPNRNQNLSLGHLQRRASNEVCQETREWPRLSPSPCDVSAFAASRAAILPCSVFFLSSDLGGLGLQWRSPTLEDFGGPAHILKTLEGS